ncbi:trigger factor [Candidatus Daviesbacteria bacterium]|nr:trigger factor [Candidatus Daviesbacteria bacterium]
MISKNITKQPKAIVSVQITVPWTDLQAKYSETLNKLAADVELPGFRKGAAPMEMVEPKITQQVTQELLKLVMPQALIEALKDTNIVPIDYPKYEVVSFQKGTDLNFKATVTERPGVKVGSYKALKVSRPNTKQVTEEEVNKVIDDLFKRFKARQTALPQNNVQAGVQTTQNNPNGSLQFQQTAAPQPAANVNEPNDEFAKQVGAQSLEDLKLKIKQDLEAEAKYNNELDYEEAILQEVEKMTQVEIPDILIQDELNRMLVSLQRRVADMGLLMDDYLRGQNKTVESLKQEWHAQAEKNVRMELGLSEIAKAEGVNISDEELQAEIDKIQDNRVKMQFESQEPRMHLRHALRQTKTLNLLKTLVG